MPANEFTINVVSAAKTCTAQIQAAAQKAAASKLDLAAESRDLGPII